MAQSNNENNDQNQKRAFSSDGAGEVDNFAPQPMPDLKLPADRTILVTEGAGRVKKIDGKI